MAERDTALANNPERRTGLERSGTGRPPRLGLGERSSTQIGSSECGCLLIDLNNDVVARLIGCRRQVDLGEQFPGSEDVRYGMLDQ